MIRVEDSDRESDFVLADRAGEDATARCDLSQYESVVVAVVDAVEAAGVTSGFDYVLDDVVDTDSLERLFADKASGAPRAGGVVVFEVGGATVTVTSESVEVYVDGTGSNAFGGPART